MGEAPTPNSPARAVRDLRTNETVAAVLAARQATVGKKAPPAGVTGATGRGVPDISGNTDPTTGDQILVERHSITPEGVTDDVLRKRFDAISYKGSHRSSDKGLGE